ESAQVLFWREHCLECSPPECYHSCSLYRKRIDKRCVRLTYGIYNNPAFSGIFDCGADLRFRRWGKLGTVLYPGVLSVNEMVRFRKTDSLMSKILHLMTVVSYPFNVSDRLNITCSNPQRISYKVYAKIREKYLNSVGIKKQNGYQNCFIMECYSFEQSSYQMLIEYKSTNSHFRNSVTINPGVNCFEIPAAKFGADLSSLSGSMIIFPENNLTPRIVFTWINFVKVKKTKFHSVKSEKKLVKVKCVAWDLDNTLWNGTLVEMGEKGISIPPENISLIEELDKRGIVQTVISKNSHDEAMRVIQENGLEKYFIYPAINWGAKSENLGQIAKKLNINVDSFALIDDSEFERSEVSSVYPEVKTYSEKQISSLLDFPEFDIKISSESQNRRLTYISNIEREHFSERFGDNYIGFLRDCQMQLKIVTPSDAGQITRCFELIQRSNQLNLSSRRYSEEEFRELLGTKSMMSVALVCRDRFGEYGTIGFACIDESGEEPQVRDFVISCRIAQKMVERSFFDWLSVKEAEKGFRCLYAEMVKTKRNGPLLNVFNEIFENLRETDKKIVFLMDFQRKKKPIQVMEILDETSETVF
ncbi:MAG: HAD-IIIC family phosphatase, partial [Fibrobacter sp.]|nr:HAD-IIIC family phosphatase [Fibrobacter sp.]